MKYAFVLAGDHFDFRAFYIMKNGALFCDVTVTLIRQEKIGNIFFLK